MGNKIRAIVVSVSDTRDETNDISGNRAVELLKGIDAEVIEKIMVSDDYEGLRQTLFSLTETSANLILTTGGTGLSNRDNTPDATLSIIDREIPGISEAMRRETARFTKFSMISRAVSGTRNGTLIVNLPGSTKGVEQCFDVIMEVLDHSVALLDGPDPHEEL